MTGFKYDRLLVLKRIKDPSLNPKKTFWLCECDCGNTTIVPAGDLKNGKVRSCGCLKHEMDSNQFDDLTGRTFGYLTVIRQVESVLHPGGERKAQWLCQCACGNTTIGRADYLKSGRKLSCGCMAYGDGLKFPRTLDRLYSVWAMMKDRCNNPNSADYRYYGGRGIYVCDEWNSDYNSFKIWAMSNGYDPEAPHSTCTIDRIDVNGDYTPNNCRWVDMKVQAKNKQRNKETRYL